MKADIRQGAFGRWYLFNPADPHMAWSGSRWMGCTSEGVPTDGVQICNFTTEAEAALFASEQAEPRPTMTSTPGTRARCAWEVTAGLFPGHVIPELTRRWCLTSEEWNKEGEMSDAEFKAARPNGQSTFGEYRDAAFEYAKTILDPRSVNHVRVDWIWY